MVALAEAALDLQEGITDPTSWGCLRWPPEFRLRSTLGQLVMGRCKATNLCDYCGRLAAIENSEVLALDALQGIAPQVWAVLTTPSTDPNPAAFYRSRDQVVKALRRRWPALQWAALVEFTTGYGTNSGGKRRPHWNLLLKGVTPDDIAAVRQVIEDVWCPRVGGSIDGQHVGSIREMGGLMRYVALHFQKESQRPPEGWRGHRFLKSRGYLWTDTTAAREEARAALRLKRELWRAERAGLVGEAALEAAELAVYEANELAWELVRLQEIPAAFDPEGFPSAFDVVEHAL
jgi:hypothetical protein